MIPAARNDFPEIRDAVRALVREGRVLRRLAHPHLVRAFEVHREPLAAIVLETLPGQTVDHLARHAEDSELLGELAVMIPWLQAFHPASVLELDYGGLTPHVWPDDSAFDLWTLLDALEEGDEATAGLAQERLNRRWGRVGMLAHAN